MKISKNHELAPMPASPDALAQVRERCRRVVRKRAAISAGVAAVPLPGVDILADLTAFATMVEEINKSFGLTPEQIERLQPRLRIVGLRGGRVAWGDARGQNHHPRGGAASI
jgi:hypothetical protein